MADKTESLKKLLGDVLVPLIEGDEGTCFLVSAEKKKVVLHLAGSFGGCPGTSLAVRHVIEPLVQKVYPKAKVEVTSGWTVPEGAVALSS